MPLANEYPSVAAVTFSNRDLGSASNLQLLSSLNWRTELCSMVVKIIYNQALGLQVPIMLSIVTCE